MTSDNNQKIIKRKLFFSYGEEIRSKRLEEALKTGAIDHIVDQEIVVDGDTTTHSETVYFPREGEENLGE